MSGDEEDVAGKGAGRLAGLQAPNRAARRASQEGPGSQWTFTPGEWETSAPPPSVLYFRALLLRRDEPAGHAD